MTHIKRTLITYGPAVIVACIFIELFVWLTNDAMLCLTGTLLFLWCWAHDVITR